MRPECSTMHNGSDLTVLEERERDEGFFWDKAGVKNLPRLRAKKAPVFKMCPCGEIVCVCVFFFLVYLFNRNMINGQNCVKCPQNQSLWNVTLDRAIKNVVCKNTAMLSHIWDLLSLIFEFEEKILPYLGNCEVVDLYVLHYFIQKSVSHGFKISKCVILE